MKWIHVLILQKIDKFGQKFKKIMTAGDDSIVFFRESGDKIAVRFYPELETYSVIKKGAANIGVKEQELYQYFA